MAQAREASILSKFTVVETGEDAYAIHIEDAEGRSFDLTATADQIDEMADALDEALFADDADGAIEDEND